MTAIAITRTDMTAVELRAAAGREKDGCAARRMLALAMVFEGVDRASAATSCGMDRQILRDWVLRYNEPCLSGCRIHPLYVDFTFIRLIAGRMLIALGEKQNAVIGLMFAAGSSHTRRHA
jgi:hypothetical protein